jgi:hypothetical protein
MHKLPVKFSSVLSDGTFAAWELEACDHKVGEIPDQGSELEKPYGKPVPMFHTDRYTYPLSS